MKSEKPEPDADQLLKLLDLQLAQARQRRLTTARGRNTFRVLALLALLGGLVAALLVLEFMVSQLPKPPASRSHPTPAPTTTP